jgi:hypothetical protein
MVVTAASNPGLERANEIRKARSERRREVYSMRRAAGRAAVAQLLEDPPDWLESLSIGVLLRWPWGTDPRLVRLWLEEASANPLARVAGPYQRSQCAQNPMVLSERQRLVLSGLLRGEG